MSLTKTIGLVAATTFASVAFGAVETSNDTLAQIAELRAELASIKAQNGGEQWLTEQRATQIRGIVQDVLADSETRQSLQASGATSGYNGGFFIGSADGNNSLKINILEQIRFTYNDNGDSDNSWGFENKRTRLTFSGNIVDSSWTYNVSTYLAYDNNEETTRTLPEDFTSVGDGNDGILANAFVNKDFNNGFGVTAGQFQNPGSTEQGLDAGNLQFVERSTVSYLFNTGFTQGLALNYTSESFRAVVSYNNGWWTGNQGWGAGSPGMAFNYDDANDGSDDGGLGFDTASGTLTQDPSFVARIEYRSGGNWAQFSDQQSWRGEEAGFMIGASAAWSQATITSTAGTFIGEASFDAYVYSIDATYEFGGGNISAAFYYSDTGDNDLLDEASTNPYGFTLGGGFFISDDMELVARYEFADLDVEGGTTNDFSTMAVGWNWYFSKNTAKLNTSFGYAFDSIADSAYSNAGSESNWIQDTDGADGQWTLQAQLSFSF